MVKIHIDVHSRFEHAGEPVMTAIPFQKGQLWPQDLQYASVLNGEKNELSQFKIMSSWQDGSVKWLNVQFLADLPANQAVDFCFVTNRAALNNEDPDNEHPLVFKNNGVLKIDTGVLQAVLETAGADRLFSSITAFGNTYGRDIMEGPTVIHEDNSRFSLTVSPFGWEILESGPVHAVLRMRGKHTNADGAWLDYDLLLHVYKGKPWIRFEYQLINREPDLKGRIHYDLELNAEAAGFKASDDYAYEMIRGIEVRLKQEYAQEKAVFSSGFHHTVKNTDPGTGLKDRISAETILKTASEMFPEVLFGIYAASLKTPKSAVSAGIYQAYQNFPKGIDADDDGITLWFLPKDYPEMLKFPQGAARTTRFHLCFYDPTCADESMVDEELMYQMPPIPVLSPEVYAQAGVFDEFISEKHHHPTERFLYRFIDSRAKGLGMLHFGDGPEWEYVKQGRSGGRDIWINNEYDMPHNFMVMLARTMDRRYFDYLKASTEHWYDMDLCHFSETPNRENLLYTHNVDHVTGQPVPSHQWVEGFLDYYHLTGNPYAKEAAFGIAEALLELTRLPLYSLAGQTEPREIGWAMRTFIAMYNETYEEKWLRACEPIIETYRKWAKTFGTWSSPFPDNYMSKVPFMITVGIMGIYGYYKLNPSEDLKDLMLTVIDDMVETCYCEIAGTFYGKQSPPVRYLNLNGMILQSLAVAYELTNDPKYIEAGMGFFTFMTVENQPPLYDFEKVMRDPFTVIYNCPVGPKRCAQSLLPILQFYKHAVELSFLNEKDY